MPRRRRPQVTEFGPDVDLDSEDVRLPDGTRLTNEVAEHVAEEMLTRAGRRGRPSLTGQHRRSPQIAFRVPDETLARAQEVAEAEGVSISQLAREALEARIGA